MSFIGLLRTLERISRPPTRPTFSDTDNPLTECEAQTECLVPEDFNAVCRCAACVAEERAAEEEVSEPAECECWPVEKPWTYYGIVEPGGAMEFNPDCPVHGRADTPNPTEPRLLISDQLPLGTSVVFPRDISDFLDDTPNPVEPGSRWCACGSQTCGVCRDAVPQLSLSDSELSAVRGLLRERYDAPLAPPEWRPDGPESFFKSSAPAEPAPSSTIVQSAPPPTVDGEGPASVRDIQPSPEAGRPDDGDCFDYCVGHPEDAAAEWIGWAVPAICTVLHEHRPFQRRPIATEDDGRVYCSDYAGNIHQRFDDYQAWLEHVAPLVANNIAPQPK